jgi:hypothetical protein
MENRNTVFPKLLVAHSEIDVAPEKKTDVGFPKNKCRDLFDQLVALLVLTCRQISCRGIVPPTYYILQADLLFLTVNWSST